MNKNLILVVDDEPDLVESLKFFLEDSGNYDVITAENGVEALEIIDDQKRLSGLVSNRISCVITDIKMPKMNGIELLKKIRANEGWHHLPVVLLSAHEDFKKWHDAVDAQDGQVTEYLTKPIIDLEEFLSVIDRIVIKKEARQIEEETREKKYPERLSALAKKNDSNNS